MKAGIYARVSTHDQKTLDMQLDAMKRYAKARDWQVETEIAEIRSAAKDKALNAKNLLIRLDVDNLM